MTVLTIVAIGLIGAVWWARRRLVVVTVAGDSMAPTLRSGDVLLARRCSATAVRAGHIVVARRSYDNDLGWDVKRVAAIHPGGLYLLGDNRNASKDSRTVGLYTHGSVLAVVVTRIRPGS